MNDLAKLFHEKASSLPQKEEKIIAREAVRCCLGEIKRFKKQKKIAWAEVAEIVKAIVLEKYGISIRLTETTARRYYYELTSRKRSRHRPRPIKCASKTAQSKPASLTQSVSLPTAEADISGTTSTVPASIQPASPSTAEGDAVAEAVDETTTEEANQTTEKQSEQAKPSVYEPPSNSRFTKGYKVKYLH